MYKTKGLSMRNKIYDKSLVHFGVAAYIVAAALAFMLGIEKPIQSLRDMFNPVSNGHYLGINKDYDFQPIYDDNYVDIGSLTYLYNPNYIGKFHPSAQWYINAGGLVLGLGAIGMGLKKSEHAR